ncbi:hypothetical protein [Canibacter zhoujuaniae]|uniref:hypothetical protein n=1 Tax=Canibacter zhoujuaniae TaxID=2708343 RepID=UPI00141D7701|nr:hypothetical protein [Canibacter zhoujuaniae]
MTKAGQSESAEREGRKSRRVTRPTPAYVDDAPTLGALDSQPLADRPETWGDQPFGGNEKSENAARLRAEVPPHYGKTH